MDPYNPPKIRFPIGDYAPYLHAQGLSDLYRRPSSAAYSRPGPAPYAQYDFASDQPLWRARDGPQTVEQIIAHGYFAVPRSEPEIAIVSDRHSSARLGLDDAIQQIRHRYEIYSQNMYELELSICEANNAVFRQEAAQGCPANDRQQYSANKRIQLVYEQERSERVTLWRDVARVRALLPEAAQQYLSAYRKLSILEDTRGDGP